MIGRSIGNYLISAKVGEGGMGVVYRAEHRQINRAVAIKVLHPGAEQNPDLVARFFNEAQAATQVRNEHVVEVLDFGELPERTPYLVMEWLEGQSLGTLLRSETKLTVAQASHVLRGILRALKAAHAKGVVHRDLKPDNVFLVPREGESDLVKVLDFGIAKIMTTDGSARRLTQTGAVVGTPQYMSPEQCRGSKEIDARTDVYALGVIAYQMLTGCLPFGAVALGELLYKHLTERPPSLETLEPSVPAALCSLIAQTLEKEPEDRPTLAQIDVALGAASAKDSSPDTGRFASRGGTRALEAGPPTTLGGAASQVGPVGSGESERRGRSWIPRIVAATLVVGGAAAAAIVSLNHKSPPAKIEIPPQTGPKETVLSGPPEPPPPTPPAPVPAPPSPDPSPDPIAAVESPAVAAIAQGKAKNKIKNKPKGKTNEAVEGAGAPVPGMAGPAGEIYRGSKLKIETEYPGP